MKEGDSEDNTDSEYEEIDINIEDIEIGNEVLSFNESTKQLEWKKVLDTFKRKNNKLIVLKLSNGIQIKSTPEHRFFVSTSPASIAGGVRTSNNWIEAAYLEVGMKLLDTELKGITIEEINEELGQVEVYNFEVQDNHNYFAGHVSQDASASFSGVLVHNDYKPNEAQAFNDKAKELQTATLIQPVIDKVINEQPIQGSNTAYSYPFDNTLNDLIQLTNNNSSLNAFQKIEFANQFQVILTKYNQNIINYNEANNQANKVVIQIQLLQGQKALDSGFIAEEANKNLKAAENTIKQIKEQINDKEKEKVFDILLRQIFFEQAAIEGIHWLESLNKVVNEWVIVTNAEKHLADNLKNIIKKAQEEYVKAGIAKLDKEKEEMIKLGNEEVRRITSKREEDGKTVYGNSENDPPVAYIEKQKYQLQHMLDDKPLTYKKRIDQEIADYNEKYKLIKAMPEGDKKTQAAKDFWNKLTSDIEDSATKGLKWTHLERQQAKSKTQAGEPPYYAKEYDKYIGENKASMDSYFKEYEIARGGGFGTRQQNTWQAGNRGEGQD